MADPLRNGHIFFLVAQSLWFIFWLVATIWGYIVADGNPMGRSIRGEIAAFRLHAATFLAMIYIVEGTRTGKAWKGLIPLFCVQFIITSLESYKNLMR